MSGLEDGQVPTLTVRYACRATGRATPPSHIVQAAGRVLPVRPVERRTEDGTVENPTAQRCEPSRDSRRLNPLAVARSRADAVAAMLRPASGFPSQVGLTPSLMLADDCSGAISA